MKTILSFLSLVGILFIAGCATENAAGGSNGSVEYSHGVRPSPQNPRPSTQKKERRDRKRKNKK